jgi:uncharacterized membrane protein YdjX (TVP38/TMEM64 family)
MRRKRTVLFALSFVAALLALAPSAFAVTHGGQGIYGPTNDKEITDTMFIIMGLLVVIIVAFSLLQAWLEHRKHARQDAAKRRESAVEWKGGW